MKMIKKDKKKQARNKYRILCKEKKIKREKMEEIDIIICLNKETRTKRISKNYRETKKNGTRSCVFWRKWRH